MTDTPGPGEASPAGMYDYYLGGSANTPADRMAAEHVMERLPDVRDTAWANRGFLLRAVRWMVARGIVQFMDIGAGLPTQRNTHEVVAGLTDDGGRVIYVDNDPAVVRRGQQMLTSVTNATVIDGDLRQPAAVFAHPETQRLIDLRQPVGLLVVAVTQFVPDSQDPWGLVRQFVEKLAPGSYLALSAPTADHQVEQQVREVTEIYAQTVAPATARSRVAIERFFDGLEIEPPYEGGERRITYVGEWGADDPTAADSDGSRWFYAAVARIP